MHALSHRINQSCHLVIRTGAKGLVILRQENPRRHANLSVRLGAMIELATSASGHVLLAHLDRDERDALMPELARPRNLSRAKLEQVLTRVRQRGYEQIQSPITAGVTDISCPIFGFDGHVAAALTIPYLHARDSSLPTTVRQTRSLIAEGNYTFDSGVAAAERLLDLAPRPTAIFASNDEMATGVVFAARQRGIKVPEELSIIGFDDTPFAAHM